MPVNNFATLPVIYPVQSQQMVDYFNATGVAGDFVILIWAPVWEPLLPTITGDVGLGFTSAATAATDLPTISGASYLVYDCEHWPRTPDDEQADLLAAAEDIASLAAAHSLIPVLMPDNAFDTQYTTGGTPTYLYGFHFNVGGTNTLAPAVGTGIYIVQGQRKQVVSDAAFAWWVGANVDAIRKGNASAHVYVQVSVDTATLATATVANAISSLEALTVAIDGFSVFCGPSSFNHLQEMLSQLRGSGSIPAGGGYMAGTGTLTIGGTITGLPTGSKVISGSVTSTNAVGETLDITLVSGDNTITVPTGTTSALIQPPSANTIALKIKGAGGDTGILISKTNATVLSLDSTVTTFIINAASLTATPTEILFM